MEEKELSVEYLIKNHANMMGHEAETIIMNLLLSFKNVTKIEKDRSGSKFDIYYTLKNESVKRGLQVKSLTPFPDKPNQYVMYDLDRYPEGMVIVAINEIDNVGMAYIHSEKYKFRTARVKLMDDD